MRRLTPFRYIALPLFIATVLLALPATCDPARVHEAGSVDRTIDSGGVTREYLLHVPPSYTGEESVPLILNFHGLGGNRHGQADYSDLPAKADEEGFIVVSPQALSTTVVPVIHWNIILAPDSVGEPDDLGFVNDLLDALEAELCIDSARVFAAGMSNGAEMTTRLACSLSERIAAVAPVAGIYYPPLAAELPEVAGCPDITRPMPIVTFHGTGDTTIPFDGGPSEIGALQLTFSDIDDVILPAWAALNGCSSTPSAEQVTEHVQLVQYTGCTVNADVLLYVVEGGRHQWPGAEDIPQPDVADEISATDLIWEFFQAHPFVEGSPSFGGDDEPSEPISAPTTGTGGGSATDGFVLWIALGIVVACTAGGLTLYVRKRGS